jgi:acetylornithine deacetylase
MDLLARTREILGELIAFPTVSSDSNLELITYAADLLSSAGATLSFTRDETGTKANLFATLGPAGDGGIVLSGHTDVVPVAGQDWTSDPFAMDERDGLLFGRGACDMKGFIACVLAMAPYYGSLDLKRPLHVALTHDEEVGCMGARTLVAEIERMGLRPAVAIIGEPTSMRVIEGHKGCHEYTIEFTGLEGHGSRPELGVNAVEYAARYIGRLLDLREALVGRAPARSRFTPPWTTLQIGRISGGVAHNVIAGQCSVDWEMRPVQRGDADFVKDAMGAYVERELKPAMRAVSPNADIVTHTVGEIAGLAVVEDSEARDIVFALTGQNEADVVAFGTEAGLFQALGMSVVVCGPGSIDQAHKPDEYVALDQLSACLKMLEGLGGTLAG